MTDLRLDPEALMADQHDAPNARVVNYSEIDADRGGNGHFVAVLVYDGSFEELGSPEAHVTRRVYVCMFDKDGERVGSGSTNMVVETWFNDFAAFEVADKRRRAEREAKNPSAPEPKIIEDADLVEDAWECGSCGYVYAEDDKGEPTYECATCGESGAGEDARRCGQCHKFAAKQGDFSCPNCEAPEDEQTRVFAKPTDQGTLATWTYPGMERDEYLESVK